MGRQAHHPSPARSPSQRPARDPGDLAAGPGRLRTGAGAARPDGEAGSAGRRRGRRRRRVRWDGSDLRHLGPPQHPHRRLPAASFELATEAVWGRAGRRLAPPHPLLHALGRRASTALVGTDGAPQDRFQGGSQRVALRDGQGLGGERVRLGAPGAEDRTRGRRSRRSRRRRRRCGPSGRSSPSRHPRRPHRLRPAAAGAARPADPADAAGRRDQDDGDLRGAVLAEPASPGRGRATRPGAGDLRQLAARRQPRRPPRLPRGPLRPRTGRRGRQRAARGDPRRPRPPVRRRGRRGRSSSSSGSGPRRSGRAAATAA